MKRGKNNPARVSVEKQAGAERDGYACPKPDGTIDYNTYEDRLARIVADFKRYPGITAVSPADVK